MTLVLITFPSQKNSFQISSSATLAASKPSTPRRRGPHPNTAVNKKSPAQDELLGLASDPSNDPLFKNNCLNMDVLYRTGENHEGILTYTPRLISVNYQGSLGSLSSRGRGTVSTHKTEPHKKNLFLHSLDEEQHVQMDIDNVGCTESQDAISDEDIVNGLEKSVQFWSDYSKAQFHPRSLYELSGLWMDAQDFDNYGIGKDVFSEGSRREEMSERLRFFVEESDHIQGIQFIVDDSGGFSSVAADFLEHIADEYENTPVLLYTARSPGSYQGSKSANRSLMRDLHDAVSFSRLSPFCKLVVPVGLPSLATSRASNYLFVDDQKPYHSSAVYAAALHSLSLPFRMQPLGPTTNASYVSGGIGMNGVVQMLTGEPRQNMVALLDAAIPAPSLAGDLAEQPLLRNLQPLTPEIVDGVEDSQSVEWLSIHGCFNSGNDRASVTEVQDAISAAYRYVESRPRFCHLSTALCPLPIPLSFPKIFNSLVRKNGQLVSSLASDMPPKGPLDVDSIPMAARLRSSSAIFPFLSTRLQNLRRLGIQQGAAGSQLLRSWGFEKDELEDMGESLSKMVKAVDPGLRSSSDDSD
ncbi:misato homolog 1-like protein [Drosera capensis]